MKYNYKEMLLTTLPYKWYYMNRNTKHSIIQTYLTPNLTTFAEALPYKPQYIKDMDTFFCEKITKKIDIPCDINTFIYGLRFGSIEFKWCMAKLNLIKKQLG